MRRIALPGAIVQIAVATALGAGLAALWGWPLSSGIVFGSAMSVASSSGPTRSRKRTSSASAFDSVSARRFRWS